MADGPRGLHIIDVSDPSSPTNVGQLNTPGFAFDVAVADNHAYVADGQPGLRIFDVSDPSSADGGGPV